MPFAREYGGHACPTAPSAAPRSSRTFYARGQTGQQLLLGAYSAHCRDRSGSATVKMHNRVEMLDVVSSRRPRASASSRAICVTGAARSAGPAHAVILATGGYGNVFFLSTNAMGCNVTAAWRALQEAARLFANPCFTQIHPTCIPVAGDTSRSSR